MACRSLIFERNINYIAARSEIQWIGWTCAADVFGRFTEKGGSPLEMDHCVSAPG
jgi:hypothetical protein